MSEEDEAIKKIMQLALYGAMLKPKSADFMYEKLDEVLELFKVAGLIDEYSPVSSQEP